MSGGMAEVIAAHMFVPGSKRCFCGEWRWCDHAAGNAPRHAAHVAEELTKAGYGRLPDGAGS